MILNPPPHGQACIGEGGLGWGYHKQNDCDFSKVSTFLPSIFLFKKISLDVEYCPYLSVYLENKVFRVISLKSYLLEHFPCLLVDTEDKFFDPVFHKIKYVGRGFETISQTQNKTNKSK